jgi:thiamine-phosphate pyrophosphorylase
MAINFKIIVITLENPVSEEGSLINALFRSGLELLHIRKPGYTLIEVRDLISSISVDFHPRIVIHNHYELSQDFHLKGIHLPENVRREKKNNETAKVISTSFHSLDDILIEKRRFEYAFLSPVFSSISKEGYQPCLNIQQIKDFLAHPVPFPLVALGGITDKNIMEVRDMGFNGAACIGYIWESQNPVEQFAKLKGAVTAIN